MALFIFFATAAGTGIISPNFWPHFDRLFFYIFRWVYIIIFLGKIFRASGAGACKFFFALAHLAHIGFSSSFFLDPSCLVLFYRYGTMRKETHNILVNLVI